MATTVVMPQLGNTVESCLLTAWHVNVGDSVTEDTVLCDIETDKSTMDVPAGAAGTVLALLANEGDDVAVKSPIAVIGAPGEAVEIAKEPITQPTATVATVFDPGADAEDQGKAVTTAGEAPDPAGSEPVPDPAAFTTGTAAATTTGAAPAASPRARALAAATGVPLEAGAPGSGPHGRIIATDIAKAANPGVTAAARQAGGYSAGMTGSGIGGRVTRGDLADPAATTAAPASGAGAVVASETELKGIRKLIADRMTQSLSISAQLSYQASAPATALLDLRKRMKASDPARGLSVVTIGDLVGLIAAKVVAGYPNLNAHLTGGVLTSYHGVNLGMAVDTPRGLMVPTIVGADSMGLRDFAATTKDLAAQAQSGKIDPGLLSGATFTVTNLGSFGIESFTPIVNQPQTGILGINTIAPAMRLESDGSITSEQRISFSLTADHQVVDGADAARFLRDLTDAIASADLFLIG